MRPIIAATALLFTGATLSAAAPGPVYYETPAGQKPRVVITADPELDDNNSMIRYLLYSTDFRTEGLIYASSQFHWAGDGKGTTASVPNREYHIFGRNMCPCTSWRWAPGERFINEAVDAYAKAYPNLRVHDAAYPSPAMLRSKIRWGNVQFDGEMAKDTPGSDLIRTLLLDDEKSPIYLHAWGGQSTIARALKSIEERYKGKPGWPAIRAKVIAKAVIHPSGDQDDTYAKYIKPNWPEIRVPQRAGGVGVGYRSPDVASLDDARYFSVAWTRDNVSAKGPLGALYRVWGDGRQMAPGDRFDYFGEAGKSSAELKKEGYIVWVPPREKGAFLAEGDTGTFLNLIDNGLGGYRADSFGGWGGHARRATAGPAALPGGFGGIVQMLEANYRDPDATRNVPRGPTSRFLAPMQRDFAARLAWGVTPRYAAANHNPRIALAGPSRLRARPGQQVVLAARTSDPDGDAVALAWWVWREAGSYAGEAPLRTENGRATLTVPADAKPGDTIQVVAEATDSGAPALTRYAKVVIAVER